MTYRKPKIIVVLGPTASGKSDVAIKLAKKFGGEVISADSRQVYRGMDLGTGKVKRQQTTDNRQQTTNADSQDAYISEGIAHYLIDVTDPDDDFNISHFKKIAEKAIQEILQRGKVPIICGGTGFWIQAVVDDVVLPDVKPDEELRNLLRNKSAEELFAELKKLDPERAGDIDSKNPARLIRAIEIAKALGHVPKKSKVKGQRSKVSYDFLQIGIDAPREKLNAKIKKRLGERFDDGMIEEVEKLHHGGVSWERLESFGLEYRWIARFLQNKISLEEMKEKLYFDIIHYAKRQMTWFKRDKRVLWVESYAEIEKVAAKFLG